MAQNGLVSSLSKHKDGGRTMHMGINREDSRCVPTSSTYSYNRVHNCLQIMSYTCIPFLYPILKVTHRHTLVYGDAQVHIPCHWFPRLTSPFARPRPALQAGHGVMPFQVRSIFLLLLDTPSRIPAFLVCNTASTFYGRHTVSMRLTFAVEVGVHEMVVGDNQAHE